jgi:hypothetical protein
MAALLARIEPVLGLPLERVPALLVSLATAEVLFKFGSFLLECVAFLALWRGLDWLTTALVGRARA